jgi:expansin (peptidoglycan-binding protein)
MSLLARAACLAMLTLAPSVHAACPAPFTGAGDGTYYTEIGGSGTCALEWTAGEHIAAINAAQWEGSVHCGECLAVTGPLGSTVVKVVSQCPDCAEGDLDFSYAAMAAIADPILGRVPIQWERVACPTSGPLQFQFEGSNPYYLKLQVRDHRYGVQSVSVFHNGAYQPMVRNFDNHFVYQPGSIVADPIDVRITATTGEVLQQSVGPLINDVDLPGTAQFALCPDDLFKNGFE